MDKKSVLTIFGLMFGIGALAFAAGSIAPVSPPTTSNKQTVKLFFVRLSDEGKIGPKIGCGDSLVSADVSVASTNPDPSDALSTLFAIKDREYGTSKLYNALSQANLSVSSVIITDGVANVVLTGQLSLGGVCDSPRVKAQIEETVKQFPEVKSVKVTVNGKDLDTVLSGKG